MSRISAFAATIVALLIVAAPARAGDPTMPLAQVQAGMQCTGYSVIRGTEPVPFAVEVFDVVDGDPGVDGPRILVGVSGPAVDRTGIGPGFSGSPIYCPDAAGVARIAGAISETIGEYGGKVALAAPIESILSVSPQAPRPRAGTGRAARTVRGLGPVRPLTAPLTVSGVGGPLGRLLEAAGRRAGRQVLAAPAGPAGSFPVQALRPGSAMAAGLSSGDLGVSALGTVAYVDGPNVWGFAHPFENSGARSLLLQDAYVFRVISNPNEGESSTYKFGVAGHVLGTVSNDAASAVAGRLGVMPRTIPVRMRARDADTGRTAQTRTDVADESMLDHPGGSSAVALIAPAAVLQTAGRALRSAPTNQAASMCAQLRLDRVQDPVRICNRYVAQGGGDLLGAGGGAAEYAATDLAAALSIVDGFKFGRLRVTEVTGRIELRRGIHQAYLVGVRAPARVRAGRRIRVTAILQRVRGPRVERRFTVRLPRSLPRGSRRLVLEGAAVDSDGGSLLEALAEVFGEGDEPEPDETDGGGLRSVRAVVREIRKLNRYDGVRLAIGRGSDEGDGRSRGWTRAYRDADLRISGRAVTRVRVVR